MGSVSLRRTRDPDKQLVKMWHSDPQVQAGFYSLSKSPRTLTTEEHDKWWRDTAHWTKFTILYEGKPVGLVRISHLENWCPEIALSIGYPKLWGLGIGRKALEISLRWLRFIGKEYVNTVIMKSNKRALRLFKDFKQRGDARKGEIWVQKTLS